MLRVFKSAAYTAESKIMRKNILECFTPDNIKKLNINIETHRIFYSIDEESAKALIECISHAALQANDTSRIYRYFQEMSFAENIIKVNHT